MKVKQTFTTLMLAAAALLASCSQEDALQTTVNDNDGRKAVTVTATLPEGSMTTRAANAQGDEEVNRCLIQIFEKAGTETQELQPTEGYETPQPMTGSEAGGFSTTAMLNPTKEYTILFWADEGADAYDASADLRNVKVADDAMRGIAYAGKTEWSSTSGAAVQAELKHAVAKVTLRSTTDVDAGKTVSVTVPAFYTAYDVSSNKVTGDAVQKEFTHTVSETITGKPQEGAEVFSFYALVQEETQNLTLNAEAAPVEIPNVPLAPNKHTILVGDVRNLGLEEVTFTATIDDSWGSTVTEDLVDFTQDASGNYTVYTAKGLQAWASHVNQRNWDTDCTLAADITLTGENNWTPVGTNIYAYSGTFDGAGHTISGMVISGGTHTQGFIGHLSGTVKNLTITDALVSGSSSIGGIVGYAEAESSITGCTFSGTVSASQHLAGGIVGYAEECHITGCAFSGDVSGTSSVGGIVEISLNSQITACWSTAGVTASTSGGCIVGNSEGQNAYTACYWGNTDTAAGSGGGTDAGIIHVDGSTETWNSAMDAMNSYLTDTGYRWELNTGSDKEDVPLVLVRQ